MQNRLFFTTDIHGSERCFRKFVNAAKFYEAEVLILGGDVTGKAVIPIVECGNGQYRATITSKERIVPADELPELEKEISFNGYYPYVTGPEELAEIEGSPQKQDQLFQDAIRASLVKWLALAEERLKPAGIRIYVSPGNDDEPVVEETLSQSEYVVNPEEQVVELFAGVEMMSFGYSNPTPWDSPRELPESEIMPRLDDLAKQMDFSKVTVFNVHVPPFGTPLDQAPKLDSSLKPVVEGGSIAMAGCGSTSVRDAILRYQPTLGLHGHVHESAGAVRLGKTLCINPGSEYNDGVLRGAIVNIDPRKKKVSYQLTVG